MPAAAWPHCTPVAGAPAWATPNGWTYTGPKAHLSLDLALGGDRLRTCLGKDRHRNAWTTYEGLPSVPNVPQRLITAIRGGAPAEPNLLRGVEVQAMLAACVKAATSGGWEKLPRH